MNKKSIFEEKLAERGLFRVNNVRYLKYYLFYISQNTDISYSVESEDKEELQRKINMAINNVHTGIYSQIEKMNEQAIKHLLPNRSFRWIEKNEDRMVYFVWSMLRFVSTRTDDLDEQNRAFSYDFSVRRCLRHLDDEERNPYHISGLNKLPLNSAEALELIYDFFDQWDAKASAKEKFMDILKEKWRYISHHLNPNYSWIEPKNKAQNIWIYNYIKSKLEFLPHLIQPVSAAQYYNSNIAILDTLFTCHQDEILNPNRRRNKRKSSSSTEDSSRNEERYITSNDVMYKMMKAWKQKRFREKTGRTSAKSKPRDTQSEQTPLHDERLI